MEAGVELVQEAPTLLHIVLHRIEGGHDGGRAEAVGDHGEVGEVSLYGGVQDRLRPGVAERGAVLVQQVHQLLADNPGNKKINKIFLSLSLKLLIRNRNEEQNIKKIMYNKDICLIAQFIIRNQ